MARDMFHQSVRTALEKDGWVITDDPLYLKFGDDTVLMDLAAEKIIVATKGVEKIAVEVKSFLQPSAIHEFHSALGQYLNYKIILERQRPDHKLLLAIPKDAAKNLLARDLVATAISTYGVHVCVYDPKAEVMTEWIFKK
jgi:hypothetical protein